MQSPQSIDLLTTHKSLWDKLQPLVDKKRFPQSLLLVGPRHAGMLQFANRLMASIICQDAIAPPCGHCSACHLLIEGIHPDIHYISPNIKPDGQDKAIKIDQIRELQQDVYQTPKRGNYRFILISPADKMNRNAVNALLKVLEEPPAHTIFLLLAEQVSSLPPTIMSRCQQYVFAGNEKVDYLMLASLYAEGAARTELYNQSDLILTGLTDLLLENISPCTLAAKWSAFAADDLLWFLYLLNAQIIDYQLRGVVDSSQPWAEKIAALATLIPAHYLFKQIDQINALMRKINHNVNTNQTLALENLLLGYMRVVHG